MDLNGDGKEQEIGFMIGVDNLWQQESNKEWRHISYDENRELYFFSYNNYEQKYFISGCGILGNLVCYSGNVYILTMDKSNVEKIIDKCEGYSEEYTINYNTDGVIELNSEKVSGTKTLTNPTKEGYIFEGWYLDSNFSKKVTEVTSTQRISTTGCLEGYNDVMLFAKWKKELKNNDVSLIADKKILDDLSLKVEKLEDKKLEELVTDALEKVVMYDINLLNELNEKVQPTSKVKVIIPIPEDYDKTNLIVYRIENEELIEYPVTVTGNNAEIETDHFSVYVLGEKKIVEDTKDEEVTNPEENETNKEETKDEEVSKDEIKNPETGDNVILYIGLGFVIIICSLMVIKKLKLSK